MDNNCLMDNNQFCLFLFAIFKVQMWLNHFYFLLPMYSIGKVLFLVKIFEIETFDEFTCFGIS